jgi:hypothetical protein
MLRHVVGQLDQWVAGFITGFLAAVLILTLGTAVFLYCLFTYS